MIITTEKKMRPRDPHDHYPTPIDVCRAALRLLPWKIASRDHMKELVADPGAGSGVWGQAAGEIWVQALIDGCDIRDLPKPQGYEQWITGRNFLSLKLGENVYDLVMGNPWYKDAEAVVRKSICITRPGGYVCFLLRLAFLEGQDRGAKFWKEFPPQSVHVLSARPSFITSGPKAGHTDATAYAIYIWQKGWMGQPTLGWLDWLPKPVVNMQPLFQMEGD